MARNVFILGAGASREAGGPLMDDFIDTAREIKRNGALEPIDSEHFQRVFDAIRELRIVNFTSVLNLYNIESIFGAFEMGKLIGRLGDLPADEIKTLSESIKRLIVMTLERSVKFPFSNAGINPPVPYGKFFDAISKIQDNDKSATCSIITFNYDIALDFAARHHHFDVDYGFGNIPKYRSRNIKILKLHGSINWGKCDKCQQIVPYYLDEYFNTTHWNTTKETEFIILPIGSHLRGKTHCDKEPLYGPIIVPPTWNKTEYQKDIANVWAGAAAELAEAENIFVIGYSLPESDMFFRFLFALGTVGTEHILKFWVVDPDEKGLVKPRFDAIVADGIRPRYEFKSLKFADVIPQLHG